MSPAAYAGAFFFLTFAAVFAPPSALAAPPARGGRAETPAAYRGLLRVTADPRTDAEVEAIWRLADHVLEPHDPARRRHSLVLSRERLQRLRALGIAVGVASEDLGPLIGAEEEHWIGSWIRNASPSGPQPGSLGIFGDWWSRVRDLDEIYRRLDELAAASNGRASVLTLGQSIEGREIRALRILATPGGAPPADDVAARPSILVTGTHHAREWASPMVTLGIAEALVTQYERDPRVRRVVDSLGIYVVPVVNVDGYVATHNGQRLRRKNMNQRCAVDLNRNYDIAFGLGVPADGCTEETYPGPFPFSEPETRAIKDLADSLPNLKLFLDYHAPAEQVMIPFAHTRARPANFEASRARAELYARTLQRLYGTLHPARDGYDLAQGQGGGAIDWFRTHRGESFAVELRHGRELAGFELPAEQIVPSAEENWLAFLELSAALASGAEFPDGEGPAPLAAPPAREEAALPPDAIAASGCTLAGRASPPGWLSLLSLLALAALLRRRR